MLLGADRAPAGDDRRNLPDLAAMIAAATRQRPDLLVVLAGGAAAYESLFFQPAPVVATPRHSRQRAASSVLDVAADVAVRVDDKDATQSKAGDGPSPEPEAGANEEPTPERRRRRRRRPTGDAATTPADPEAATAPPDALPDAAGVAPAAAAPASIVALPNVPVSYHVLLAPDAEAGSPPGSSLQQVLEGLRSEPNDSRLNIARSIASLAYLLDRSIEVVEVGLQGGLVARAEPFGHGHFSIVSSHACLVEASFAPARSIGRGHRWADRVVHRRHRPAPA